TPCSDWPEPGRPTTRTWCRERSDRRGPVVLQRLVAVLVRVLAGGVELAAEVLHPLAVAAVSRCLAAGEQARVLPDVPLNLTIGDTYAILVMGASGTERLHAMVVHPSDLHDRLVGLFEVFWGLALPISPAVEATGPTASDPGSRRLLTLLAAGLTDESIARELGVSERTVARRIVVLQRALGAQGRFQLGVQAIRHGLL
ncbi:MAG: LuxR C-terminal-related transcriptional regulator, partial [Lapillicoccus sp.]